ncbi:MAG: hypothetical protein JWM77_113, partial [Rhodospirillales bacterium]|nr:hypothetical protein [Rhodospirillales bacterium]
MSSRQPGSYSHAMRRRKPSH